MRQFRQTIALLGILASALGAGEVEGSLIEFTFGGNLINVVGPMPVPGGNLRFY